MNFSKFRLDFKKGIFKKSEQEYKLGKANRKKELKNKMKFLFLFLDFTLLVHTNTSVCYQFIKIVRL